MILYINQNLSFKYLGIGIILWLTSSFLLIDSISTISRAFSIVFMISGLLFYIIYTRGRIVLKGKNLTYFFLILFSISIAVIFNAYTYDDIIKNFFFLCIILTCFSLVSKPIEISVINNIADIFYWLFFMGIVANMFTPLVINNTYAFKAIGDQNFTGVLVFLFFLLSWHQKRILGIILCFSFLLFMSSSRSLYGMFFIFFLCFFLRAFIFSVLKNIFPSMGRLFCGLIVMIVVLSYFWLNIVAVNPLSAYREGFNDGSNKMRFAANVYAINLLRAEPELMLSGYGSQIKSKLGIEEEKSLGEHTRFEDVRLVQPHNSFLNLFLRMGVFPTLLYIFLLSKILERYYTKSNIEYIIPYLINASFIHSCFSGSWLLVWLFILFICSRTKRKRISL